MGRRWRWRCRRGCGPRCRCGLRCWGRCGLRCRGRCGLWGCQGARVVEAITHVVGGFGACVQGGESEGLFAEADQAYVRVLGVRDVAAVRVGADYEAGHAVAVAELCAVAPGFDFWRGDVVGPTAPVVPGG